MKNPFCKKFLQAPSGEIEEFLWSNPRKYASSLCKTSGVELEFPENAKHVKGCRRTERADTPLSEQDPCDVESICKCASPHPRTWRFRIRSSTVCQHSYKKSVSSPQADFELKYVRKRNSKLSPLVWRHTCIQGYRSHVSEDTTNSPTARSEQMCLPL